MIKYSELAYRRSSLSLLVVFVLMSVGINLLFLVLPLFSMQVFDRVLSSESLDTLTLLLVITLFLLTVQTSLDWLRSQMMLRSAYYLEEQTRIQVTEHDLRCSASGSSISSARADLETVRETLSSPGIFSLFDAPFAPLFLLIIYIMHPTLGHFTMGGALLLMVVSVLGMKFTRQLQKSGHQHIVNFQSLGRDWMQNAESILALGMGSRIVDKWQQESVNATIDKASVKSLAIHVATFARYIRLLLQVGILTIAVKLVLDNEVGTGVLIAASMVMGRVLSPVEQSIHHWNNWLAAWSAHKRLMQLGRNTPVETMVLEPIKGGIQFERVTIHGFAQSNDTALFEELSFTLPAGKTSAIIGSSGVGKSSIIKAILGIESISSGEIRIDGAGLQQYQGDNLGRQIGYISQNCQLLTGTVAQNIARFDPEAPPENIISAAKFAGIHERILALPDGYQTLVGSAGLFLSAGQCQQIALARACFGEPALLVLDEPDTHLDYMGQQALTRILSKRRSLQLTTILVTHRYSLLDYTDITLLFADRVLKKIDTTVKILGEKKSPGVAQEESQKNREVV